MFQRTPGEPEHLRSDPDPAFVQSLDRDLVPFPDLPEHRVRRDRTIVQDQLTRRRCADAELILFLPNLKPGGVPFDEEAGNALVPGFGIRVREDEV